MYSKCAKATLNIETVHSNNKKLIFCCLHVYNRGLYYLSPGKPCVQIVGTLGSIFQEEYGIPMSFMPSETSENCLNLDIYTPALTGSRPVMIFIHGGFFSKGNYNAFILNIKMEYDGFLFWKWYLMKIGICGIFM